ncbi:hypothetical protein D3C85_1738850 [compost metagenome]
MKDAGVRSLYAVRAKASGASFDIICRYPVKSRAIRALVVREMMNLLFPVVFFSYTRKNPLNSDVQPVKVVGPSKRAHNNRA